MALRDDDHLKDTDGSADTEDGKEEAGESVTIQPAAAWPVFSADLARAELLAMQLLAAGHSVFRVRHMTSLTAREVRRLAAIVAEEALDPRPPRIVGRSPQPPGAPRRGARLPRPRPAPPANEPVQMSLLD